MYRITNARYTRTVERDDTRMAEVRVQVEEHAHEYIAYFTGSAGGVVEMPYLLYNDADFEIDYWDNPMHQAFGDISMNFSEEDKRIFRDEVMRFSSVRQQIEQALSIK
jgi:hypothetical protein